MKTRTDLIRWGVDQHDLRGYDADMPAARWLKSAETDEVCAWYAGHESEFLDVLKTASHGWTREDRENCERLAAAFARCDSDIHIELAALVRPYMLSDWAGAIDEAVCAQQREAV